MKITFPREKRKIKLSKYPGVFYLILGRGTRGTWWLQDFWGVPYTFKTYKDARVGAKKIGKMMAEYEWKDSKAVIAKISL